MCLQCVTAYLITIQKRSILWMSPRSAGIFSEQVCSRVLRCVAATIASLPVSKVLSWGLKLTHLLWEPQLKRADVHAWNSVHHLSYTVHICIRRRRSVVCIFTVSCVHPQHTATHCKTLQHTVHIHISCACEAHTTRRIDVLHAHTTDNTAFVRCTIMCWSVLQCVAVYRGVLQCVAVCCSALQCVAVCWCVVGVCCSVLRCVAVCSSV